MKPYAKAQTIPLEGRLDRRRKLSDEDYDEIMRIYARGGIGCRKLAQMFHVSRSLIVYIVNPERRRKCKERQRTHWKEWHERRGKEGHAAAIRKTRRYKYDLYKRGVIGQKKGNEDASETNRTDELPSA